MIIEHKYRRNRLTIGEGEKNTRKFDKNEKESSIIEIFLNLITMAFRKTSLDAFAETIEDPVLKAEFDKCVGTIEFFESQAL